VHRWKSTAGGSVANKRVFLSFAYEDIAQVRGLRLLAANPDFDLEFFDESVKRAVNSSDESYVRSVIRARINRTSVTVCLISKTTHTSTWVDWELSEGADKGNAIIAMALKGVDNATLPTLIKAEALTFHSWDPEYLGRLIANA
jgi:hypothetical protein